MKHDTNTEVYYLDLHHRLSADKSFLGGLRLGTRNILFLLVGLITLGGFAALYYHVDQQMGQSLSILKESRVVSQSVSEINRAIGDVRFYDRQVREAQNNDSPQSTQLHRRAIDQILTSLDIIQQSNSNRASPRLPSNQLSDSIGTIRDAFSSYGLDFSAMIDARNNLGLSRDTGLRFQRRDSATIIRELFTRDQSVQYLGLMREFSIINNRADIVPSPANENDVTKTGELYDKLISGINQKIQDAGQRSDIIQALQTHRQLLDKTVDMRARLETPPAGIIQILDYIAPSIAEVSDYGTQLLRISPLDYEREYYEARKTLAAGSAILIVVLVLAGITLMHSITNPLIRLSNAIIKLAKGDQADGIPLQGNDDEIGDMANAFDKWLDKLTEIDHLKTQLDDLRMRLALGAIAEGIDGSTKNPEDKVDDDRDTAQELMSDKEPDAQPQSPGETTRTATQSEPEQTDKLETIGTATRQLNRYNESVNLAAKDVERTEIMINLLSQTTRQVEDLEVHISAIRDDANLMIFNAITPSIPDNDKIAPGNTDNTSNTGNTSKTDDNLNAQFTPPFTPPAPQSAGGDSRRFEKLRTRVNSAEQIVDDLHRSLDKVNHIAHDIASLASVEALDATRKLMTQSERLQSLLDELINKVSPTSIKPPAEQNNTPSDQG